MDGIDVPADYFNRMTEFAFGSIFGLVERQARVSQRKLIGTNYSYRDGQGRTWRGLDRNTAFSFQNESHGEITEHRFWAVSDVSWSLSLILVWSPQRQVSQTQTQQGQKVALSGGKLEKYNEKVEIIKNKLKNSKKCRDFLISKGIDPDLALQAINEQIAWDGKLSTISRIDAGVVSRELDLNTTEGYNYAYGSISNNFNGKATQYRAWTAFYYGKDRIFQLNAEARNEVYYAENGINTGTILHEALHSLTGLGDLDLADKLGVKDKVKPGEDTSAISGVLKNNDCGN